MIEAFSTGAVFEFVDRFTPNMERLGSFFERLTGQATALQAELNKIGLDGTASNFERQFAELNAITERGLGSVVAKFEGLDKALQPLAKRAFNEVTVEAILMKDAVVDQMGFMAQFGSQAAQKGFETSAPMMFSSIPIAARTAGAEAVAAIKASMAEISALKAETNIAIAQAASSPGVAVVERAAGLPGMGLWGRSAHDLHYGRVGGEVGGIHVSATGTPVLAAAGLALDGIYEAAQIQDFVAKALATSQIKPGPDVTQSEAGKRIWDLIQGTSKSTGFSFHDTGEGVLEGQRLLNQMPFKERNALIEKIMPSAAYEARMKGSTLPEAIEAIIGIAHQTQTYDAAGIEKISKSLAYTSILTPSALPQFQKTLGYALPELYNGLGMDPSTLMLLTATMQQSGIAGKSGTWLRSFFENSEPGSDEHNEALKKLGMLDASGKPSWRIKGGDGQVDWDKSVQNLSGILQHDQQTIPIDDRIGLLRKAYGERGAGFASLMMGKRFTENLSAAEIGMNNFSQEGNPLDDYAKSSLLQQSRMALQEFNSAMADLGTHLMPAATKAVSDFASIVKSIDEGGWKGALKEFYDHAIKPDLGPIPGVLTNSGAHAGDPPMSFAEKAWRAQHGDQAPPAGMFGGRVQKQAYIDGDGTGGSDLEDTIYRGTLRAFTDFANGGTSSGTGSGGGYANASYEGGGFNGSGGDGGSRVPNLRYGHPHAAGIDAPALIAHGAGGSRSWRNNNPGNIEFGGFSRSMGAVGSDGRFAVFPSYEVGRHAQEHLLFESSAYRNLSLAGAIGKWAPGSENNVPAYIAAMHADPTMRMRDFSAGQRQQLMDSMQRHEGWHAGTRKAYSASATRSSFVPPARPHSKTPIRVPIHLDGKIVAEVVTHHQMRSSSMSTGPHYHDDSAHYAAPDTAIG